MDKPYQGIKSHLLMRPAEKDILNNRPVKAGAPSAPCISLPLTWLPTLPTCVAWVSWSKSLVVVEEDGMVVA